MATTQTTGLESKISNPQTETPSDYPFEKHWGYIHSVIYAYTQDHHLSEDITQKTFLKAWLNRHKFDPERAKAVTWLYVIAKNILFDHIRVKRPFMVPNIEGYMDVEGYAVHEDYAVYDRTPDLESIRNEDVERLKTRVSKILKILNNKYALKYGTLLRLQFFHGLTGEEFAQVVGLCRGTVRWRIYRAKLLFKEEWQKRFATPKGGTI